MAAVEEVLKAADCFEVLGMEPRLATCTHPQDRLRRCTNCESDFKQALKVRQLQVHPDKNPGETQAADAFKQVMHAWSQVSEAGERQTYLANLSTRATLELQKATALASMRAAASSAAAEPAASSAEVPAAAPKVLHVPGDYSVHIFTKHVRAQLDVGLSRNFPFRSAADREAAIQSAKDFLAKVHDFTNAFDACPNAAARKAFLEPFKIKPLNTKGATREAFHKACCGKSCSYFENALAEKQPDEVAAQQQAMGADSVGGMDIHGSFFNKPELKPPKHHPGAFTAFRKAASGRDSHGLLLGQKRTSGFRVTNILISSSKDLVAETARKAILEKGAEGYVWIGTVCTEHMGLQATPDQADIDYAKQCCEQHPGLPHIFVKVCYGGVATGDWKGWELHTSTTPVQIHIHFAQRGSLGENFHFLDLVAEPVMFAP